MSYSTYDFSEALERVPHVREEIKHVHAAWGYSPEGYGSWTGGFLFELKDGRFCYLSGWCDTTGWGCQDGIETTYYDTLPDIAGIDRGEGSKYDEEPMGEWEIDPADLNRFVETGEGKWD